MSLRVRLPLDGNLENKGLDIATITNNGATIDNDGKTGQCYAFNGSTSYISISDVSKYIKGGSNPFSISFWMYHSGNERRGILFGGFGIISLSNILSLEIDTSNRLRFWWSSNPDWRIDTSLFTIVTLTWYHIAVVYDGVKVQIYVDGDLKATRTGVLSTFNLTTPYYLGRDSRTGATAFQGKLNDFRIYDHALSTKEIKEISRGLILHYKLNALNDPPIKNIVDCSGYGRDPSNIVGTINLTGDSVRQKDSIYLNGSSGIMSKLFYTPSTCSYCLWVNIPNTNAKFFIDARKSNAGVLPAYMSGSTFLVYSSLGGTNNHSISLPLDTWFHLTVTLTPTSNKVYINSILKATGVTAHGMNILTYITLGMRHSLSAFMKGSMNDFRMYAKELTPEDILDIMTPTSIDNKGDLFCYDLIEDNAVKINSTGVVNSESINEESLTGKQASICKDGTFKVNEIIEK